MVNNKLRRMGGKCEWSELSHQVAWPVFLGRPIQKGWALLKELSFIIRKWAIFKSNPLFTCYSSNVLDSQVSFFSGGWRLWLLGAQRTFDGEELKWVTLLQQLAPQCFAKQIKMSMRRKTMPFIFQGPSQVGTVLETRGLNHLKPAALN